jgi:hypothetical protein
MGTRANGQAGLAKNRATDAQLMPVQSTQLSPDGKKPSSHCGARARGKQAGWTTARARSRTSPHMMLVERFLRFWAQPSAVQKPSAHAGARALSDSGAWLAAGRAYAGTQ